MIEKEIRLANNTSKAALIGVLLLAMAVVGYVLLTRPMSSQLSAIKTDITTKNAEFAEFKERLDFLNQAEKELELTTEVQRLESLKSVPVSIKQDEVIKNLIDIAKSSDIELHSISFSKGSTNKEGIGSLRISSSFEGNYLDLTGFLEALEENARIFKVESISVQVARLDISDVERTSFSLTIETFYQN